MLGLYMQRVNPITFDIINNFLKAHEERLESHRNLAFIYCIPVSHAKVIGAICEMAPL